MISAALASAPNPNAEGASRRAAPPRLLGRRIDDPAGPRLLCVGGIHGNEPSGVEALQRVFRALEGAKATLRGGIVGFAGNRAALAAGRRYVDRDLNRLWRRERLETPANDLGAGSELAELAELHEALSRELAEAPGRVFLLDLHSTSGAGSPFAVLDDALPSRRQALAFPVPLVLGLEEELAGTLVFHWTARGVPGLAFEGGQHDDPRTTDHAEAAIWLALAANGILPRTLLNRAERARRLLRASRRRAPHLVEVRFRHRLESDDEFQMLPGFASFDPVRAGQVLARDRRGEIAAPFPGRLLMPLYQPQGDDGFFLVTPVARFWFELSATLRRLGLDRLLTLLPGIRRYRESRDAFLVSRRVARWLVPEIFHLLGYRRQDAGPRHLLYRRRAGED